MPIVLNKNYYRIIDYLIIFLPIAIILGSPAINILLSIYSILFLHLSIKIKFWIWLKIPWVKISIIFWIYAIFLSFFSLDFENSFRASFFFIRFLLFSLCIGFFGFNYFNYNKVFKFWFFIIAFVCIDVWIQYFFGKDLFGYPDHGHRFAGLFGNELVAGAFIWKISSPLIGLFFFERYYKNNKNYNYFVLGFLLLPATILITGERTSFVMILFSLLLSILFISYIMKKIKFFVISILIIFSIFFSSIATSEAVKNRYNDFFEIIKNFNESSYGILFESGIEIWKRNKITGVGLKNFGIECDNQIIKINEQHHPCSTHPHNLYIQILSETGIIGMLIFISLFVSFFIYYLKLNLIFHNLNINKFMLISCMCYLFSFIWPIATSGSFYSTWNGIFYWITIGMIQNFTKKKSILI